MYCYINSSSFLYILFFCVHVYSKSKYFSAVFYIVAICIEVHYEKNKLSIS